MSFSTEPNYTHGSQAKTGILLVNLGTPDAATPVAVRRYLREFLSDTRIVEIPRLIWWFILNIIILNVRPKKTAAKYSSIWMAEGSPLRVYTERQARLVGEQLASLIPSPLVVLPAMRYGSPSMASQLAELKHQQCNNILVLPLYPQYAASTTGSTFDQLARVLTKWRNVPGIRFVRNFHDHPAYIDAMAKNLDVHWQQIGYPNFITDKLLMTFHGVPKFHLDRGDPYHCQCHKTARLIGERLGLQPHDYVVTFQSRFGKAEWLQPYTDKTLETLGAAGTRRIDVVCPGFAADCLETLEEIADEGRDTFLRAGGKEFNYLPVANDTQPYVTALTRIVMDNLAGWVGADWRFDLAAAENARSAENARKLGAPV
ncbi:MAG: ferrochelatase [Burkholderiales bacterium]